MLMFIYCIWFYHGAYVYLQKIIENFELVECEARSIKFKWQLNNNSASDQTLMVKCSRFDEREKTSTTILNMIGFITIDNLAPSTKYKCKLEVSKLSVGLDTSNYVYAKTLIGEACIQPVGFETGIIKEDSIASSSPLGSIKKSISLYDAGGFWCLGDSKPYIRINLGRIMTIAGLLFRTNNEAVDKIYIRYGIYKTNEMEDLRLDHTGETIRTFDYPKNDTARYWFLENSFTVKLLEFRPFNDKKPFCVQVEVYGCSEICSSKLNPASVYHILQWNTSLSNNTKLLNLENVILTCIEINQSLYFDFGKILTLSGFMMLSENVSLNIRIRYGDIIENMTLKHEASQTFSTNSIPHTYATFWFNEQILTRYIEIRPVTEITCMYVVFLGCNSANMKKLGIENESPDITLTESSSYGNGPGNKAVKGRLNAMRSDWTFNPDTDKNPWYQICFLVILTVSAIAVQGQGYWYSAYITEYSIEYGYSANTVSYIYSFNGLPYHFNGTKNRYATSVNHFPVEISAQCLRIVNIKYFSSATGRFEVLGDKITYPPNITIPKHAFNIKNSTAIVKCVVIGQPGLLIQWRKQNEIIVDNKVNYTIVTSNSSSDVNGTYTSKLEIKPLVHLNVDNDDTYCHGDIKNVSCFFNYSISTGYALSNLFVTNTTLIYYGFDAEIDLPSLTIIATNISINITWTTEKIRDFQIFYNFSLIEHDGYNNITQDNKTRIDNIVVYNAKPYTFYTFQLTAFNRLGVYQKVIKSFLSDEGYPSVIQNFTALATSKEDILLYWNHPKYQYGIITNYTVEYAKFNFPITKSYYPVFKDHLKNQNFTVAFGQLKNYQKYKFRVKALTNHGMNHGEWSEWVDETTFEGTPSVPEDLIGHASSTRSIKLEWTKPRQLNGIVRSYTVVYSGFKAYSLSFKHTGEIVVYSTKVTILSLFPGTKYTICVNAETIVKGPSSMINITLPYDEPLAPLLKLENQNSEQRTIVLHSVPSFTGPISHYEFDIQENFNYCLNNSNTTFKFLSTLEQNQLVIAKGEENITFQTNYIHLSLIGKFRICYRAVINDSGFVYMGAMSYLDLERNDLAKIKKEEINVGFNSISLRLSKGPLSTKYYQIIVFKGNPINRDPSPSELKPYSEKSNIYLAAEFNASEFMYYENFIVGDGSTYKRFRNAYSNFYKNAYDVLQNVELQNDKSYSILQRAYEHETKYYSTPWLLNIQTDKMPIKSIKKVGISTGVIGVVTGTAVCVILAVLGILLKRRKKQDNKIKKEEESTNLVPLKPVSSFKNPSLDIVDENLDKDKRQFFDKEQPSDDHSRMCLGNSSDVKTNYINASVIHGYTKHVYTANKDVKDGWIYENIYDSKDIVKKEGFKNPFNTEERETELDPKRLRLEHELGQGNFGSVVKGVYMLKNNKSVAVAVKTLKEEDIPGQKSEIVKEAEIMSKLDHPNIVRLIGVTQSPGFMLVMELAPQGPLHKFLEKNRKMKVLDILVLMLQVDEGMNYLESQHFVHRDLAARNVLVVSKNFVKISDFGMSRAMGVGNEYYRAEQAGRWPLKWYAPECIYYHKFSSKGDVWSYGITMWEAVSYGGKPYQGMIGSVVIAKLESGYRLQKPDNCSDVVYTLMLKCWETNPDDRPSFMEIGIILSQYIQNERVNKK
ncbi:uncharacterized protein LOC136082409 [Hydra vulgaris]|uniref:receptor protein-tyrosine kinase n=1 Tax=Hydra vulgaris TaxID=6087 RepID=A0ABM4C7V8_HYDVU